MLEDSEKKGTTKRKSIKDYSVLFSPPSLTNCSPKRWLGMRYIIQTTLSVKLSFFSYILVADYNLRIRIRVRDGTQHVFKDVHVLAGQSLGYFL